MNNYIKLLRPHQYLKNLFIFAPLFFSGKMLNYNDFFNTLTIFILFSLLASSVYIFNDIFDRNDDRKHYKKKYRPIASGKIKIKNAVLLLLLLMCFSLISLFFFYEKVFYVGIAYLLLNILYSLYLKHMAPYDIVIIAVGFVLRLYAGALSLNIVLSDWIIVVTFFLALFLGTTKRFAEVEKKEKNIEVFRKSIDGYNHSFILVCLSVTASVSLFSYVMFAMSKQIPFLFLTTLFVVLGIFRFLQLTLVYSKTEDTTLSIIKDRHIQIIVLIWISLYGYILYA